jgi:hypothetical protein
MMRTMRTTKMSEKTNGIKGTKIVYIACCMTPSGSCGNVGVRGHYSGHYSPTNLGSRRAVWYSWGE